MPNFLSSTLPTTSINLNNSTFAPNLSPSSSFSATFLKLSETALNKSMSATSAPIKIENVNLAPGSTGNSIAETEATAAGSSSAASSFSAGLNNLYVGSVPENLLLPFFSQQAAAVVQQQQQQQQQQHQQNNLGSSLNTQSLATTVHSLLSSQPQHFSAFNLQNTNTTLPFTLFDIDSTKLQFKNSDITQFNTNNLATSLPPMNILLNNFISNSNKNFNATNETSFSKQIPTFGSSVSSIVSMNENSESSEFCAFSPPANKTQILINRLQGNNSRTTSESSVAEDLSITPSDSIVGTATNNLVPAVENIKLETFSVNSSERSSSSSPLKMRVRLNSRTKTPATENSPTPSVQPLIEEEVSNICNVCGDEASGRHYGASTCFGCKGFFRRTVRANKTYNCRYEERCEIDKVGRNTCRACRFRKCLEVGMEPDAIRPDRDKTGRQKNPRRSSVLSSAHLVSSETPTNASYLASTLSEIGDEKPLQKTIFSNFDNNKSLKDDESKALAETMVAERDLVINTLLEIERICEHAQDKTISPTTSNAPLTVLSDSINNNKVNCLSCNNATDALFNSTFAQIIMRPSLRTQVDYSGQFGALDANNDNNTRNLCCIRKDFYSGFSCILKLAVNFSNTLKPIADISVYQRENLIRSFISSYIVFTSAFRSVSAGFNCGILLPNGRYINENTKLSHFIDVTGMDSNDIQSLSSKIHFICKQIIDCLQNKIEKLKMSQIEYVCLKAILALDPTALGINSTTVDMLSVARDSVQNALFLHLMEKYSSQQAVFRFGQLLMLISNASKIGAFLNNIMDFVCTIRSDLANSTFLKLFTGLDKLMNQSTIEENIFKLNDKTNNLLEIDERTTDSSDTEMDADDEPDRSSIKNDPVSRIQNFDY